VAFRQDSIILAAGAVMRGAALPTEQQGPFPGSAGEGARALAAADREAIRLCHGLAGRLFPWDLTRSLELALLKAFCVPSISGLLAQTGEFLQRPRKRYDDTGLMVAELLRHGPDSPAGEAVISRLNRIHGAYPIRDDDYRYVLSTFVCEPIRWLARYGWRPLSAAEQEAIYRFWRLVGERMGIPEIPPDLPAMLAFNQEFEAEVFAAAASNRQVADATLEMLLRDWPAPLRPGLGRLLAGLLSRSEAHCLGWSRPASPLQGLLLAALRCRSRLAGLSQGLRPPQRSRFFSEQPTTSYGKRFQLAQLGPPARLAELNRPRWAGRQRRIGLTGGIASGKSTVGRLLAEHRLPVLDADVFAREALAPGSPGAAAVLARYGERVAAEGPPEAPGGALEVVDRAALGRIVFTAAAELRWLEHLVHPLVRARFAAELERLQEAPALVLMIPLLFEVGLEGLCSEVWLVDCDEEQQLQRLMGRDGLSDADARARLAAQWPLARKRALATVVLDNRGGPEALAHQVARALRAGAAPAAPAPPPA
jgi:dephospho-CoA kinase